MTWWDKLRAVVSREADAAREGLGKAADALDEALAKKERELDATPAERVDMLLEEIAEEDRQFGELEAKLRTEGTDRAAQAGIEPPVPAPAPEVDLAAVRAHLTVTPVEASPAGDEKTSHLVALDDEVTSVVEPGDLVNDLLAEVMVLDAARRDDTIALRTPTLDTDEVADLVAGVIAARAPDLATPPRVQDPDLDDPGDEGPEDLAH